MVNQLNIWLLSNDEGSRLCVVVPFWPDPFTYDGTSEGSCVSYPSIDSFVQRLDSAGLPELQNDAIKAAVDAANDVPNRVFSLKGIALNHEQLRALGFERLVQSLQH